jgi:hypothetical protein
MEEMKTTEVGPYTLVARFHEGAYRGALWSGGKITDRTEGQSLEDVWRELQGMIAQEFEQQVLARAGVEPTAEEARRAFIRIEPRLSTAQLAMLRAHVRAPGHMITATRLAEAAGYKGYSAANLHYGLVGAMLFAEIPQDLPRRKDNSPIMTCVIAHQEDQRPTDEGHWIWKMRPYIVEGLAAADIA